VSSAPVVILLNKLSFFSSSCSLKFNVSSNTYIFLFFFSMCYVYSSIKASKSFLKFNIY
jgi:hypothetical protein